MCGRYTLVGEDDEQTMARLIDAVNKQKGTALEPGDIKPSELAPVLRLVGGEIVPDLMTWGYPAPKGVGLTINARSETVLERPMFREDFLNRRCLIPAGSFYEWDRAKRKYLFGEPSRVLYMAGFYREDMRFVIMTREPVLPVSQIHNRMPVLIREEDIMDYLSSPQKALDLLGSPPPTLTKTSDDDEQLSLF